MTTPKLLTVIADTMDFSAAVLRELETRNRLGFDSLAGQAIEAQNRLRANAALLRQQIDTVCDAFAALHAVHEAGRVTDQNLALHCAEIARRAIAKAEGR